MEQVTIEVKVGTFTYMLEATICAFCGTKVHPINTLVAHEATHITSKPGHTDLICKTCHTSFTYPIGSGPHPTICPDCRAKRTGYKEKKVTH